MLASAPSGPSSGAPLSEIGDPAGGHAGEVEPVGAGAAGHRVVAVEPEEAVVAVLAAQRVVARPAGHAVVARPGEDVVELRAADERVGAAGGLEHGGQAAVEGEREAGRVDPVVAADGLEPQLRRGHGAEAVAARPRGRGSPSRD